MGISPDSFLGLQVSMIVISTIAVALRFWSRALTSGRQKSISRFWWDDWLALADLPFVIATCSIAANWVGHGLGKHYETLSPNDQALAWKLLFSEYLPYDMGITLTKLSVIFFYLRVFEVNDSFRKVLWLTGLLVISWMLFALFSTIFQCKPISKSWLPLEPGTCINIYQWWLGSAISSLIIDFIILLLPVPMLLNLQMQASRKFLIMVVFAFGYLVIGVTIGRLVVVTKYGHALAEDITFNVVDIGVWLTVEGPIGLLTISLPSIFSLVRRGIIHGPYALFSSKDFTHSDNSQTISNNLSRGDKGFKQLTTSSAEQGQELPYAYDPHVEYHALALRVTSSTSRDRIYDDTEAQHNVIYIRQDVDVMDGRDGG